MEPNLSPRRTGRHALWTSFALASCAAMALAADSNRASEQRRYEIDPDHSELAFTVRHFTIAKVRGTFEEMTGAVILDVGRPDQSTLEVVVEAETISTQNAERDEHLRGPDFLAVDNHPQITFHSRAIRRVGSLYTVAGDLTLRGVTRPLEVDFIVFGPVRDPLGRSRLGAEGTFVLDRRDFGLIWNRTLDSGGLFVSNEVVVDIALELLESPAPAANGRQPPPSAEF